MNAPTGLTFRLPRPIAIGISGGVLLATSLALLTGISVSRQHAAVRELWRLDADIFRRPRFPRWLEDRLSDGILFDIEDVSIVLLDNPEASDSTLNHLSSLRSLELLSLDRSAVTDAGLAQLRDLPRLESLSLNSTQVTDSGLRYLERMPNLRWLSVKDTRVTHAGLADLQRALPGLTVEK